MGALRKLKTITRTMCIIETQLTRQNSPIISGWGQTSITMEVPGSLAIFRERNSEQDNLASYQSLSFIPNLAALCQMLYSAGFSQVFQVLPHPDMNFQYVSNDRAVFAAFK